MTVQQLYEQYRIPPNLQRHMKEVTAVGLWISDHWSGSQLDVPSLKESLLVHDLGNIIKFKKPFLVELKGKEEYWEQVQKEFIKQYGKQVFPATVQIIQEIGLPSKIIDILTEMKEIGEGKEGEYSWEARVADLADTCVTPQGIEGFETRLHDLCQRYHRELESEWVTALRKNLSLVQASLTISIEEITEQSCKQYLAGLEEVVLRSEKNSVPGVGVEPTTLGL